MFEKKFVLLSDLFDAFKDLIFLNNEAIDSLMSNLKSNNMTENVKLKKLKSLNYFVLYKLYLQESLSYPFEDILTLCMQYFSCNEINESYGIIYQEIIENALNCLVEDDCQKAFLKLLDLSKIQITQLQSLRNSPHYNQRLSNVLHILDSLCNFALQKKCEYNSQYLIPQDYIGLLLKIDYELSDQEFIYLVIHIFPKFISYNGSVALAEVWNWIEKTYPEQLDKIMQILTSLVDFFLESETSICLHNNDLFWRIIQDGLINENHFVRKRAYYFLKKYTQFLKRNNLEDFNLKLFLWQSDKVDDILKFWDFFFIVLEATEETQEHLVTPTLTNINSAIDICNSKLKKIEFGYSWIFCLFSRLFSHASIIVNKWAIEEFSRINVDILCNDHKFPMLLSSFIECLNNMVLYNVEGDLQERNDISICLELWFYNISISEFQSVIFSSVLRSLAEKRLSYIPLFNFIDALSKIPSFPSVDSKSIQNIKKIVCYIRTSQSPFIRRATEFNLLKCMFCSIDDDMTVESVIEILSICDSKLVTGTVLWEIFVSFVKNRLIRIDSMLIVNKISDFIFSVSPQHISSAALLTLAIIESGIANLDFICRIFFNKVLEQFFESQHRSYCRHKYQDNCLLYLKWVMELSEFKGHSNSNRNDILGIIEKYSSHLLSYIEDKFRKGPWRDSEVSLYSQTLETIFNHLNINISEESLSMFSLALEVLRQDSLPLVRELFALKIVHIYYEFLLECNIDLSRMSRYENDIKLHVLTKRLFSSSLVRDMTLSEDCQTMPGKILSSIIQTLWSVLKIYLSNQRFQGFAVSLFPIENVITAGVDGLYMGGKTAVESILTVITTFLPFIQDQETVESFITKSWTACFELRKSELFWKTIQVWISMSFQESLLKNDHHQSYLLKYADRLIELGGEVSGLAYVLIVHLQKLTNCIKCFPSIIVKGLIFHPVMRKDKRLEIQTKNYITSYLVNDGSDTDEYLLDNSRIRRDSVVRLLCLNMLLTEVEDRDQLIALIIDELLQTDLDLTKNNKRYFNNAPIHRKKHRILQSLLILEYFIWINFKEVLQLTVDKVLKWTVASLMGESQQPSVRYQLEWLLIRLCLHYPSILSDFWQLFEDAIKHRLGSLCSFISIAYHLGNTLRNEDFLSKCVENILPWCMAQNFTIRLYAQVVLSKIWTLSESISQKYTLVKMNQLKIQEQGNMLVNAKKMMSDFYFETFHPVNNFNLKTIFWDLPRLSSISSEEWIPQSVLIKLLTNLQSLEDLLLNDTSLEHYETPVWVAKSSEPNNVEDDNSNSSVQKKFVPWKPFELESSEDSSKYDVDGLIILASFLNKPSNLGGLTRSCEIFGAKELVLSSLSLTKSKEYQSLSMTAEKHINIVEVKAHDVKKYLETKKKLGYQLVGAEQSTGSFNLKHFKFNKKCVLLLGNEKEGIPASLLSLMDVCVEIPQAGLIRSLNVHVSGALFLWEYFKQHFAQ